MDKFWKKNGNTPAFSLAKSIISQHAKSFYLAAKFLPENKRWATYAVYGFCRYADNIVDQPRERFGEERINELNALREELALAYKYGESEHPVLKSFIIAAELYNIPQQYAVDLIEGVQMDIKISEYSDFEDLYVFCYKVAAVVGLMMTHILGFEEPETLIYAEKLGIGMQLTNILRDIKEDKDMGRIYLPKSEMYKFGISEADIKNENFSAELRDFMHYQVERARKYYEEAQPGIAMLEKNSQFAIYSASRIYKGILDKIKENDYDPFKGRVYVPKSNKVRILSEEYLKRKLNFSYK